jgi:hypothetical protein
MAISKKEYYILFLAVISFILLICIFKWIDYLTKNNYIVENFDSTSPSPFTKFLNNQYTHTVNMPINTSYSCKNFCGPTARCSITGQQCFADIDCPGCQPYSPPLPRSKNCVPGDNDAGKLTWGVTPQYSVLTTDIGTQAKLVTHDKFSKPYMANFGINTWSASAKTGVDLFDKRYKPDKLRYMPDYPDRYSLSGQFVEGGPIAANGYLS